MYGVKEIFYSIAGEGRNAGRPAVFLRFAGCNLWSGRESDRLGAICGLCDTDFVGTDGPGGGRYESAGELAREVGRRWPGTWAINPRPLLEITGGEPTLQLDVGLASALRAQGFELGLQTNGTNRVLPGLVDWITVSPKTPPDDPRYPIAQRSGDELKLVYPQVGCEPERYACLDFRYRYLQPCDGPEREKNLALCARYCLDHPWWSLSVQLHKMIGLP